MSIRPNVDLRASNADYANIERAIKTLPAHAFPKARKAVEIVAETADHLLNSCREAGISTCNCDGIREVEALMISMLLSKEQPEGGIVEALRCGRRLSDAEDDAVETMRIVASVMEDGQKKGDAS